MKKLFFILICQLVLFMTVTVSGEEKEHEELKERIRRLEEENRSNRQLIEELKSRIKKLEQKEEDETAGLEAELQAELEDVPPAEAETDEKTGGRRFYQNMNPDISVIGTFIGNYDNSEEHRKWDWKMSEVEFGFQMVVDPYIRADIFAVFHEHEHEHQGEEEEHNTPGLESDLEEAYLTTLGMPAGLQLKAGKFLTAFGKIGNVHPHELPYVDYPLVYETILGPHALIDQGLSINWLTPLPWYSEVTGEILRGPSENPAFKRSRHDDFLYLGHWKNFFDLSGSSTLELGVTGVRGPNTDHGYTKTLLRAADLTFKWKPLRYNTYRGFTWQSEYIHRRSEMSGENGNTNIQDTISDWGYYSLLEYRLNRRWFTGGRFDYYHYVQSGEDDHEHHQPDRERAWSGFLSFRPSEFHTLRIQYKHTDPDFPLYFPDDDNHEVFLEWIWVIGAHGAHSY